MDALRFKHTIVRRVCEAARRILAGGARPLGIHAFCFNISNDYRDKSCKSCRVLPFLYVRKFVPVPDSLYSSTNCEFKQCIKQYMKAKNYTTKL